MSSLPPDSDDDDTGPLHAASPVVDDDWDHRPAQPTWAGRFDAPLSVSPRPVRSQRNHKAWFGGIASVVAVAAVGVLIFWLVRPSSDEAPSAAPPPPASPSSNEDEGRLLELLPRGYAADACDAAVPPKGGLAQMDCDKNDDAGGPLTGTYTLARDKAALDAVFTDILKSAQQVNCPGNIQSPGPWRRNATPQKVSGTLFCGMREGRPAVVWTDDANLVVSAVESGPAGPAFPELYAWWSSHS